ncbi:MAG: elongation factor G [Planctomycetota bacterium]|nr:MAG: elongation factor G [Planctomycetota bacterium]
MAAKTKKQSLEYQIFGVAAHIDAGKTTVSEHMLYLSGVQHRVGQVDEGTATLDFEEMERERGITIHSAAIDLPWRDHRFTLIDTPGHVDFTVEVERCMRVIDGVILVFDASRGVEAQSETVWRQATRHGVRCIAFLNKLDKLGADWDASIESIRTRLGAEPLSLQLVHEVDGDLALVDLVGRRLLRFEGEKGGAECQVSDWPDEERELWELERSAVVEKVAECDEDLLESFLADEEISEEELQAAIRRQVLDQRLLPVLGGAALRGVGIEPLLDAVSGYLPRPMDLPAPLLAGEGEGVTEPVELDASAPVVAEVFKLVSTRHGPIAWLRVYRGTLVDGMQLRVPRLGKTIRVHGLFRLIADSQERLAEAGPGQVCAVKGLRGVQTGDTLCDPKRVVRFPEWDFPLPVISMAVEARSVDERDEMIKSLDLLGFEDPSMQWRMDEDTGQLLVSGMGELHLQILADRLSHGFGHEVLLGAPRVALRETIAESLRLSGDFEQQFPNGTTVFAHLDIEFSPLPDEELVEIAAQLPEELRSRRGFREIEQAALQALRAELSAGLAQGHPVTQLRVLLRNIAGREPGQLPTVEELEVGISLLVRDLSKKAKCLLLEPWMLLDIDVPEDRLSPVIGEIQAQGGEVRDVQVESALARIEARAPLSRLLDFSTRLRSQTQGRGSASMRLEQYRPAQ